MYVARCVAAVGVTPADWLLLRRDAWQELGPARQSADGHDPRLPQCPHWSLVGGTLCCGVAQAVYVARCVAAVGVTPADWLLLRRHAWQGLGPVLESADGHDPRLPQCPHWSRVGGTLCCGVAQAVCDARCVAALGSPPLTGCCFVVMHGRRLALSYNQLTGTIPDSLSALTGLW